MLLFESVGGPLWVFVGFGDVPSPWTLASGALLIGALVGHEVAAMHAPDEEVDDWDSPGAPGAPDLISSPRLGAMSRPPSSPSSGRAARRYLSSAPALAAPSAPWSESAR